jgi:hypothetical protein
VSSPTTPPTTRPTTRPTSTPIASADAPGPTSGEVATPAIISQTDTEWGRIWDALPDGFPRYPGATPGDDAGVGQVSAAYLIASVQPSEVADWLQSAMEIAAFSTEALSGPFEDGGYVLDSVGTGDCRIQTTAGPLGQAVLVTVRYGSDCPA